MVELIEKTKGGYDLEAYSQLPDLALALFAFAGALRKLG
jgi:hypothetical protein